MYHFGFTCKKNKHGLATLTSHELSKYHMQIQYPGIQIDGVFVCSLAHGDNRHDLIKLVFHIYLILMYIDARSHFQFIY